MSVSINALLKKRIVLKEDISFVDVKINALNVEANAFINKTRDCKIERKELCESLRETQYALIAIICPTLQDVEQFAAAIHSYHRTLQQPTPL